MGVKGEGGTQALLFNFPTGVAGVTCNKEWFKIMMYRVLPFIYIHYIFKPLKNVFALNVSNKVTMWYNTVFLKWLQVVNWLEHYIRFDHYLVYGTWHQHFCSMTFLQLAHTNHAAWFKCDSKESTTGYHVPHEGCSVVQMCSVHWSITSALPCKYHMIPT